MRPLGRAAAARWHRETDRRAGRLKQTGKQTDKQGRGNTPESNDTSHCLPSAAQTRTEQPDRQEREWGGSLLSSNTRPVMTADMAASPGRKQKRRRGGWKPPLLPTNPNDWGSINNSSGNNNLNKLWQHVGYLSRLLIDRSRLETFCSSLLFRNIHGSHGALHPGCSQCAQCRKSYLKLSYKHVSEIFIHRQRKERVGQSEGTCCSHLKLQWRTYIINADFSVVWGIDLIVYLFLSCSYMCW